MPSRTAHAHPVAPAPTTAGPAWCLLALTLLWVALMSQVDFVPSSLERPPLGRVVYKL